MKKVSFIRTVSVFCLAAICAVGLVGCSSGSNGLTGGVAATVNGVEIPEDDVTRSVELSRSSMGATSEEDWAEWMMQYGYTPESIREMILNNMIEEEVMRQGAAELGVTVEESEVDEHYQQTVAQFESEEAFKEALPEAGFANEEEYLEAIESSLLARAVQDKLAEDIEPTEEDQLSRLQTYAPSYDNARRSSHILFDLNDEATAQDVLGQLKSGDLDFAEAAAEYSMDSSSANGGDVGWDKLTTFVPEYQTGLEALGEGEISDLVTSEYGIHIIKCTEVFTLPEELTSFEQMPTEIADAIKQTIASDMEMDAYSTWLQERRDAAEIVINDMPADVSYNVDMSKYEETDEAAEPAEGEAATAEGEATAEVVEGEATEPVEATDAETAAEGETEAPADAAEGQVEGATDSVDVEADPAVSGEGEAAAEGEAPAAE